MKNRLEDIKNLLSIAAIIIGGLWFLIEFEALFKVDIAKANLELLQNELEETPVIDIGLCLQVKHQAKAGILNISLRNAGTSGVRLEFGNGPIYVAEYAVSAPLQTSTPKKVYLYEIASYSRSRKDDETISAVSHLKLDPNEVRNYAVLVDLANLEQFYHVEFAATAYKDISETLGRLDLPIPQGDSPELRAIASSLMVNPSSIASEALYNNHVCAGEFEETGVR